MSKYDYTLKEIEKEGLFAIKIYLEYAEDKSGDFYFYFRPETYYIEEVNESGKTDTAAIQYAKREKYTLLKMEYRNGKLKRSHCLYSCSFYPGSGVSDRDMDLYHKYDISPY